jgi:hypothetical protein
MKMKRPAAGPAGTSSYGSQRYFSKNNQLGAEVCLIIMKKACWKLKLQ